jgi:hypothetical protein
MPFPPSDRQTDRLLWAGVACFVMLVAGAVWLAPRLIGPVAALPEETRLTTTGPR